MKKQLSYLPWNLFFNTQWFVISYILLSQMSIQPFYLYTTSFLIWLKISMDHAKAEYLQDRIEELENKNK